MTRVPGTYYIYSLITLPKISTYFSQIFLKINNLHPVSVLACLEDSTHDTTLNRPADSAETFPARVQREILPALGI